MATTRRRPTTRGARRAKSRLLVGPFTPRFLEDLDQRLGAVQELRRRVQLLADEVGDPSYAKEVLAKRVVFVAAQLETMEAAALEGKDIPITVYTQLVNTLQGLLAKLGIERQVRKAAVPLYEYLEARAS